MTVATAFKGTVLKMAVDGTVTSNMTTIAEIVSINGPSMAMNPIDVTHTESTNDCMEFIRGLKDAGEVSFEANFLPSASAQTFFTTALDHNINNTNSPGFAIVFTDTSTTTWTFSGWPQGFEPTGAVDGKLSASGSVKLTGALPV